MSYKTKRESSQNTFFLSSAILEELDQYLSEPKSRNSRIISRRSIPIPEKELFPSEKTQIISGIEIEEDIETLINFIDIENKRKNIDNEQIQRVEENLENENCFIHYDLFSNDFINNTKKNNCYQNQSYKIEDSKQALIVLIIFTIRVINPMFFRN